MHPEARAALIREKVSARGDVPATGWRYPYGYRVKAYGDDGSRTFVKVSDYPSAIRRRDELMRTGKYWMVWLEQCVE